MKKVFGALVIGALAVSGVAAAQHVDELNPNARHFVVKGWARPGGGGSSNLSYHNGPVIHTASVVTIFWGAEWGSANAPSALATAIMNFVGQFGSSGEYKTITQYYDGGGNITLSTNLLAGSWFDGSTPPTNVTDATVQSEVAKYLGSSNGDPSTIYEVFLPSTSYSSDGSATSCGGTNLQYCAYHSNFNRNGVNIKYSSMPYPNCSGCQASGFSTAQNFQMFTGHETREAVTDPDGNAWYDRRGYEADDKCAWTNLFTDGGYGYQPEWSNAVSGCVQKTP